MNNPEVQEKHRSLFGGHSEGKPGGQHHKINLSASRLGQIVIDSTARGFGFTLGEPWICCRHVWLAECRAGGV